MYVCICNAITETDLRKIAQASAGTAEELYLQLGHEPQCYQCIDNAEAIVGDARAAANVPACIET
ncbi:MAG: (2Fe-2S)-binding protein [Sphingomonadaceae bacterium]|nr:(2Fe-2S)-binding protein [Sphingomonadaceae bacterium]